MRKSVVFSLVLGLSLGVAPACMMTPKSYKGRIGQSGQEALIVHDGERQELVLRVNYKIEGASMPENFAWVVTVPNEPDKYAVADPEIFKKLYKLSNLLLRQQPRYGRNSDAPFAELGDEPTPEGVVLGKAVTVGPYAIQPIRGVGSNALDGLNTWLEQNGFPSEDREHMRYFVENNFTFLCVKIAPLKGRDMVPSKGTLPPLHVSFKSEEPYYPLKFSSQQGEFDLNLHVLSKRRVFFRANREMLHRISWSNSHYKQNYNLHHTSVPKVIKNVLHNGKVDSQTKSWYYSNIIAEGVNEDKSLEQLESDVFLKTVAGNRKVSPGR